MLDVKYWCKIGWKVIQFHQSTCFGVLLCQFLGELNCIIDSIVMFLICQINAACGVTHFAFVSINPRNWFCQFLGELNWRVGFIVGLKKSAANFMVHVESTNWLWCIGMEHDLAHSITLEKASKCFVHYCVHQKLHNIWRQTYTKEMSPNWPNLNGLKNWWPMSHLVQGQNPNK